jgi:hypothetical protein
VSENSYRANKFAATETRSLPSQAKTQSPQGDFGLVVGAVSTASQFSDTFLAYQGVKGSHNGQPLSEALLFGLSGGLTFGYFLFAYKGVDPQVAILTRNTFDPFNTLLERLGAPQTVLQTSNPKKAEANLIEVLESNRPAIVWADVFSLSYNTFTNTDGYWAMQPVVVWGCDDQFAYLADRSGQPLKVPITEFAKARARVKKDKFRIIALDAPDPRKLPAAVQNGLWQCIRLFTEKPPRGTKNNFGLAGLQHWAKMLTNSRHPQSWARFFPRGSGLYNALAGFDPQPGLLGWVRGYGSGAGGAERDTYATFLDEAALILKKPKLKPAAELFRTSAVAWNELIDIALPNKVKAFKETIQLRAKRWEIFVEQGQAGLKERQKINERLREPRDSAAKDFPLTEDEVVELRQQMSEQVLKIHDIEAQAVEAMKKALV